MQWTVAIGIDTHKDVHVAVALDGLGAQLDSREIATTPADYRSLLSWAQELGVPTFAVEGTGSCGAGLVRFLERAGVSVYECERPRRQERRRGKSDLIDAALAARRLLGGEGLSFPRGGGRRDDLRLLLLERRSAMRARNAALNQLSAPGHCSRRSARASGSTLGGPTRPRGGSAASAPGDHDQCLASARPARRATRKGSGRGRARTGRAPRPSCARSPRGVRRGADLLRPVARLERPPEPDDERASCAGTSPVDASSGKQRRHRLNRGGDRQLNWALHVVALARVRHHPETAAYYERLLAAGKTTRRRAAVSSARSPVTFTDACARCQRSP
jgi:hypothetical protein